MAKSLQEVRAELLAKYPRHTIYVGAEAIHYAHGIKDGKDAADDSTRFSGSIHTPPTSFCSPDTEIAAHVMHVATLDDLVVALDGQMAAYVAGKKKLADEAVEVEPERPVVPTVDRESQP